MRAKKKEIQIIIETFSPPRSVAINVRWTESKFFKYDKQIKKKVYTLKKCLLLHYNILQKQFNPVKQFFLRKNTLRKNTYNLYVNITHLTSYVKQILNVF